MQIGVSQSSDGNAQVLIVEIETDGLRKELAKPEQLRMAFSPFEVTPSRFITNTEPVGVLKPTIYNRELTHELWTPIRELNHAQGLPAMRNFGKGISPLLGSSNDPTLASQASLWAVPWKSNIKPLFQRQVGVSESNKQQLCMRWPFGWQATLHVFDGSGGNLPFEPEKAFRYRRVGFCLHTCSDRLTYPEPKCSADGLRHRFCRFSKQHGQAYRNGKRFHNCRLLLILTARHSNHCHFANLSRALKPARNRKASISSCLHGNGDSSRPSCPPTILPRMTPAASIANFSTGNGL